MDLWSICDKGHVHWGTAGGAGLFFRHVPEQGEPTYLLQQRSKSVDYGGTWGIPGGAIRGGETPEMTARREAEEEIGPLPPYRVTGIGVQDCGGNWKFHILTADVDEPFPAFCVRETDATGWFTRVDMENLTLHPGFQTWLDQQGSKAR
jgi:8-oxo-dGTP diphosphatase